MNLDAVLANWDDISGNMRRARWDRFFSSLVALR